MKTSQISIISEMQKEVEKLCSHDFAEKGMVCRKIFLKRFHELAPFSSTRKISKYVESIGCKGCLN